MIALIIVISAALLLCFAYYISTDIIEYIQDVESRVDDIERRLSRREDDGK